MGLTTAIREFAALNSCQNLPLLHSILNPSSSTSNAWNDSKSRLLPGTLNEVFNAKFNSSQVDAIKVLVIIVYVHK